MHVDRIEKLPGACLFVKAAIDSQTNIILGGIIIIIQASSKSHHFGEF